MTNHPDTIFWMVFLFEGTTKIVVVLLHFKNYIILVVNLVDGVQTEAVSVDPNK